MIQALEKILQQLLYIEASTEEQTKLLNQAYAGIKKAIEALERYEDSL